ncbi:hypothetical protein [Rheinheimera faecalis]|uniref:hypothetical protein n=1 Tax=Rheinheimera faecalis TaxID=2901141 RepID=UPI001E443AE1|nr:hypothetical protein [Rheinheimera faecalis]
MQMNKKNVIDIGELIDDLARKKNTISCCGSHGLLSLLERLGFNHKSGKSDGHRVFTHPVLRNKSNGKFTTFGIDCGHAPKRPMKPAYVSTVIKILRDYQDELTEIVNDTQ